MRNTSIVGGDFINNCIVIKLDNYDTEISVINRKMRKINIIDNFEIEIGIKHLISLEAKKEFIKIITSKLNDYKHLKEIFFSVQNEDVIIREYPEIQRVKKRDLDGYINFEIVKDMPVNIEHYVIKYKVLNLQKNIIFLLCMIMHIPRLNMMEEEDFRSFQFREQKMWELNLIHFQKHTILQD